MELYVHISAGSGPKECEWVVSKLAEIFLKEAKSENVEMVLLLEGNISVSPAPSLLMKISGKSAMSFANSRLGTIRWIGNSPYRPNHKRKNWFVSVDLAPKISEVSELAERDIQYQSMKASGPGGQHVNTTDTAVRATHSPTGISVVAREERSQHMNKKLAMAKLAMIFTEQKTSEKAMAKETLWHQNQQLERGNEIRIYVGPKFKLK
tara:strand:+ start:98465 stop:99088 length:624 start_codon:yes stop_codon:yes gene_type:complete